MYVLNKGIEIIKQKKNIAYFAIAIKYIIYLVLTNYI